MNQYPEPIPLPKSVPSWRAKRSKELVLATTRGISIRLVIILAEFIGVALFNSSALLLDALASLMDVVTSVVFLIFIKLAAQPPDKDHPFGHGRYEPLAGLQLAVLMVLMGGGLFVQQTFQLFQPVPDKMIDPRAWIIPFVAVILLEITYHLMMRTSKRTHSPALAADAVHFRIDAMNSAFATLVLVCGAYSPHWSILLDHFGAIIIALFMIGMGVFTAKNNMNQLMDRIPENKFFHLVKKAALKVEGVKGTEKLRIQFFGPDAHVDIDIEVDPHLSVDIAHKISQQVRAEIQMDWPAVRDVMVHIEPFYANDH